MHRICAVATMCRRLKNTGLLCKRALQKRRYSAKETYNFKEPANRSNPIVMKALKGWLRIVGSLKL